MEDIRPCIWMDAKVVEYQLCPLKQNCDTCDFHQHMTQGHVSKSHGANNQLIEITNLDLIRPDYTPGIQYIPGHYWYRHSAKGKLRIGLDSFIWQLFPRILKIIPLKEGTPLKQGQCFCWLELAGTIVYLKAPFSGQVHRLNPDLESCTALNYPGSAPESDTWIIELEDVHADLSRIPIITKSAYLDTFASYPDRLRTTDLTLFPPSAQGSPRTLQITKRALYKFLNEITLGQILLC